MAGDETDDSTDPLLDATTALVPPLLVSLEALAHAARHLHPPYLADVVQSLDGIAEPLAAGIAAFDAVTWPEPLTPFKDRMLEASGAAERALSGLRASVGDPNGLPGLMFRGLGALPATNTTIAEFANVMQTAVLDRPVVDQSNLTGKWDFTLNWTPDEFQFSQMGPRPPAQPPAGASAPPDLFTAFQEQLGLKLESTRAPAEVLVIDRVEKPSEN